MQGNRTSGQSSQFIFSLTAEDGSVYSPTAALWEIFDDHGAFVAGSTVDLAGAQSEMMFTVPAADLKLPAGVPNAGREIVVTITVSGKDIELRDYFVLVANNPLKRLINSVMSYPEALALRQTFGPKLVGWDSTLDHSARESALINAHANLCRMAYTVTAASGVHNRDFAAYGTGADLLWDDSRRIRIGGISPSDFANLPGHFVRAIKRAQLVEADALLGGDEIGDKRSDGIISETIGESSTFYQSKPTIDFSLPISRRAFDILRGYLNISVRIAR